MNYKRVEAVIKLLNCVLVAYMWTYLIPITPSTPKRRWNRLAYTLLIMTALLLMDWSTRVLAARLPGVASETVLSYLPVMSDILAYLVVLPPLSLLVTGQKARRCFGLGALTLLALYLADLLLLLFFWALWFPDRQLELSMAVLPSDSRAVMLMAVQSIMYLLLLALLLASQPRKHRRVWYLLLFPLWGAVVSNLLLYFLIHQCGRSVTTTVLLCTVVFNLLLVICTDQLFRFMEQYFSSHQLSLRHTRAMQIRALETDYEALNQAQMRELEEVCANIRQALHEAFPRDGAPAAGPAQALLQRIAQIPRVSYCGNPLVNSVLSLKSRRAQELGIHMEIQVGHTDTGQLHNLELCSLLGNLLDNAIEACVPLTPAGEPVILVNLNSQGHLLVLAVENPVATLPKSSATGEYFTTKANPERHGLGLQSARRIAQQHDGCLLTELKGSCFRATAMLSTEIRSGS